MMYDAVRKPCLSSFFVLTIFILAFFLAPVLFSAEENAEKRYKNIMEEWNKTILLSANISPGELPALVPEEKLGKYVSLYENLKDPSLRAVLASELGKSHSKATFRKIAVLLENEKEPFPQSALLSSLLYLAQKGYADPSFAAKSLSYMDLYNTESKKCAAKLYFLLSSSPDPEKVLNKLNGKSDEYVMRDLFGTFAVQSKNIGKKLISLFRQGKDPHRQAWGTAFALLQCDSKNIPEDLLKTSLPGNPYLVRYYLARAAAYKKGLPEKFFPDLFRDADCGLILAFLKEFTANAVYDAAIENLLQQFLSPTYISSIRLAAVEALQKGRTSRSAEKLSALLLEKDPVLREKVVRSLVKMNPPEKVRKSIIQYAEKFPEARLDAVRFFAHIRDAKYDDKIMFFLDETEKNNDHPVREQELQTLAITLLGDGKVIKSIPFLVKKSTSKDNSIRKCVAENLGKIPSEKCLVPLQKILPDRDPAVVLASVTSIVKILKEKRSYTNRESIKKLYGKLLCRYVKNRKQEFSDVRAASIYAVSLLDLTAQCRKDLCTLAEKECIINPQSPRSFDTDHVRISCLAALYEAGKKGNTDCKNDFRSLLAKLTVPAGNEENGGSELWKEYLQQLQKIQKGEKISPSAVKQPLPLFSIYPL